MVKAVYKTSLDKKLDFMSSIFYHGKNRRFGHSIFEAIIRNRFLDTTVLELFIKLSKSQNWVAYLVGSGLGQVQVRQTFLINELI